MQQEPVWLFWNLNLQAGGGESSPRGPARQRQQLIGELCQGELVAELSWSRQPLSQREGTMGVHAGMDGACAEETGDSSGGSWVQVMALGTQGL